MGELRFILLLAGLLFLVALAAWELRKPRQAQGDAAIRDAAPRDTAPRDAGSVPAGRRTEPPMGSMGDAPAEDWEARRPLVAPPRIDLPDLPMMEAVRAESILAHADAIQAEPPPEEIYAIPANEAAVVAADARPATLSEPAASGITVSEFAPAAPQSVVLDLPPEAQRHIVALRIVPAANERLSGRAVRLAITACGFVHGRFGIYHQPDDEGRALCSVASLSKPGVLDPVNMDFQRLAGINLFTVLPGPLAPGAALDHLLDMARELSQRLPARVQDEMGHPLDAERLEDLRERMQNLA